MIKKRGRLLTLVFAVVPGMGHMWNGFMKRGVSLMGLFFAVLFLDSWLRIGSVEIMLPLIWFYAFFDCINVRFQDDQDFYAQTDGYLFSLNDLLHRTMTDQRAKLAVGVTMIVTGLYALWQNTVLRILGNIGLPEEIWNFIYEVSRIVPQTVTALLLLWIGWRLIRGEQMQRHVIANGTEENK